MSPVASGGLLLVAAGMVLRELPQQLWAALVRAATLTITVKDDDAAFVWVKEWFLEQAFVRRVRRVDLDTSLRGEALAMIPAPGSHWFWRGRRPFQVTFHRSGDTGMPSQRRMESLSMRTLGRDRAVLRRLIEDVVAAHQRRAASVSRLYVYDDGYWESAAGYAPRCLDSVVLPAGEKQRLVGDLERFLASRQEYRRLGVPYHRGYLFYGPPGTGKSSLAAALADHAGMSLYAVNLTEFNDRTLKSAILNVPQRAFILFEDVDAMAPPARPQLAGAKPAKPEAAESARGGVSLSGLLNLLDGVHAPQGVVYVMTTNAVDRLDPALLRPGRIDVRFYLGAAQPSQLIELYRRFHPDAGEPEAAAVARAHAGKTMAEFQNLLLSARQRQPEAPALPANAPLSPVNEQVEFRLVEPRR